jgi:tRNA pseudouridine55 synthase
MCDGVLLLDKPAGYGSTKALAKARRILGGPKGGHTGTLDPFATGLLPLVFGEATKFARFLSDSHKAYEATLRLGFESSTGDPEGEVVPGGPFTGDAHAVDAVLASFLGEREQLPPMHSAVHVQGRRLYEYARAGEEVARTPRAIEITALRRLALDPSELRIGVTCSKGTYVRVLAADIGRALGCGAYLVALRRTRVAGFSIDQALTLEALEAEALPQARLMAPEVLVAALPRLAPGADDAWRFSQGQAIAGAPGLAPGAEMGVFAPDGRFLGVGAVQAAGQVAPVRLMTSTHARELPDLA